MKATAFGRKSVRYMLGISICVILALTVISIVLGRPFRPGRLPDKGENFGCATCHVGKAVGGQSFEKMGLKRDYFADRGNVHKPDFGRFNVTKDEKDKHKFKVPTLRNIALTWPYFHDGSTTDLKAAVMTMSKYQWANDFTDAEADKVVAFLKTLTGKYEGKPLE